MKTIVLVLAAVAAANPALAGAGGSNGGSSQGSQGKSHASSPPGTSKLPRANAVSTSTTTPFALVDDASLLSPGTGALTIAAANWQGTDATETDAPIVAAAAGIIPRLQLGARVPYVVGDAAAVTGGWGTTYLTGKIAVVESDADGFKLAIAPTLQLLGTSVVLPSPDSRAHWGVPVSAEWDEGAARVFASGGFFSGGVGFVGSGVGVTATSHLSLSASLSRAWSTDSTVGLTTVAGSDRTEVAAGAAFNLNSRVAVFGSIAQTIATSDANGAGTTFVGGVLFLVDRGANRP